MSVAKFESVTLNVLTRGVDTTGDSTVISTRLFDTLASVYDIKNPLEIQERYRLYTSFSKFTFNYTPTIFNVAQNTNEYSFTFRSREWRIVDAVENGRESISFLCYEVLPEINP